MAAPAGRTPSHAGPILGMYALLATAVGCVGAAVGELFFAADRTLSTPFLGALNRCSLSYPILTHEQQYERCLVGAYRFKGLFLLGCVAYMLLFTAALIVVGPWLTRRRLARAQHYTQTQAVTERFESLCDRAGLTGRRRPRLAVAAVREAYTTVLPDGRPLVVLPLKATLDPSRFDPVVLHELAHVRARDVSLVSSVRGIAWITIPVVALASLPDILDAGQTQVPQAYLVQAVVFVAATILVAAGLLRLREIAADRQAARWLRSPQPLRNLLDTAEVPAGTAPNWSRWRRRLLARHPSVTARLAALGSPLTVRDVGFATALAVGAVAAMAMNTCSYFASSLDYAAAASLPPRVWAATGGVVLGLGLAPAFLRSAAQARLAGLPYAWWAPVAGVSLGLLLGSVAAPGTATNAVLSVVVGSGFGGVATAVILACAGAGLAALAAGLASLAAERYPHRPAWLVAGVTVVIACCSAVALVPVRQTSAGLDWHVLIFDLQATPWRSLLLLYPAAVIALAVPSRGRDVHGLTARAVVSTAITPAGAAVIAVAILMAQGHLDEPPNAAIALQWLQENWWVCAFTGWAVLVIVVLARGMAGLARACVTAWLTTVLVCVGSVAYEAVVQGAPFVHFLSGWTNASSVWLFFLALPTSLLALVRIRRPVVPQPSWLVPAGASAAAAAAAVLVFVTGIPGLLDDPAATPFPYPCGTVQHALPFLTLDADQVLTTTAARHVIDAVCVALPVGWTGDSLIPNDAPIGPVTIQPADCERLRSAGYLSVLGNPVTQADGNYQMATGALAGTEYLTVLVNSFSRPVPSSIFTAADTDLAPCHRYAVAQQGGTLVWTVQRFSAPAGGVRIWGTDRSTSYRAKGGFVGDTITLVMASVGRDLIIVSQQTKTLDQLVPEAASPACPVR